MSEQTFHQLTALLDSHRARYRVVGHPSAGNRKKWQKFEEQKSGKGRKP